MALIELTAKSNAERELDIIEEAVNTTNYTLDKIEAAPLATHKWITDAQQPKKLSESLILLRKLSPEADKIATNIVSKITHLRDKIRNIRYRLDAAKQAKDLDMTYLEQKGLVMSRNVPNRIGFARNLSDINDEIRDANELIGKESGIDKYTLASTKIREALKTHKESLRDLSGKLSQAEAMEPNEYHPKLRKLHGILFSYRSTLDRFAARHKRLGKLLATSGARGFFSPGAEARTQALLQFEKERGGSIEKFANRVVRVLDGFKSDALEAWTDIGVDEGLSEQEIIEKEQVVRRMRNEEGPVDLDNAFFLNASVLLVSVSMIFGLLMAIHKVSKRGKILLMRAFRKAREKFRWRPGKKMSTQAAREMQKQVAPLPTKDKRAIAKVFEDAIRRRSHYESLGRRELAKRTASVELHALGSEILDITVEKVRFASDSGNLPVDDISRVIEDWGSYQVTCTASKGSLFINGEGLNQLVIAGKYVYVVANGIESVESVDQPFEDLLLKWEALRWEDYQE